MTDASGTVVWEAGYMPFGEARVLVADIVNNLRFPGQYFDAETGFHYNRHRYYDPDTGRYLTPDPIGLEGGLNLYVYVDGNPVNWVDPEGLNAVADTAYRSAFRGASQAGVSTAALFAGAALAVAVDLFMPRPMADGTIPPYLLKEPEDTGDGACDKEKTRSPHPPGKRKRFNTKKGADEAATKAGKGNKPVNHPDGPHGPHFHPGDGKGKPLNHDHYYYPKHRR
jgi:RHS repeat-associated protein